MHCYAQLLAWIVTLAVTDAVRHEILSMRGEDVILHCEALSKPAVQYRSVIWYKVNEEHPKEHSKLSGLIMKKLTISDSTVSKYKGVTRHMELLENSTDLLLPNVTAEDGGIYSCFLSAPLGHQNQEGKVHLKVYDGFTAEKKEKMVFNNSDTIYIAALTVLVMALIIMFISYVCLKNIFQSKNSTKDSLWKMPHQRKQLMVTLQSKNLVCKTLPEVCV